MFLERKYLLQISSQLKRFKQKKDSLFSFRCPICNDSEKNEFKTRGFIYTHRGSYLYKCHNCQIALSFKDFLKAVNETIYNQYLLEKLANNTIYIKQEIPVEAKPRKPLFREHINLPTIASLEQNHPAKEYVSGRMIPQVYHSILFYADDFAHFTNEIFPENEKDLWKNDQRLVIPFYDENRQLLGFQGRSIPEINPSQIRYITIKLIENNLKVFGMERVNQNEKIYVFEGPIDSLFIPNAVATCDASLLLSAKYYTKANLVLVFDNQYQNKDVRRQIQKSINQQFNICLFPKSMIGKDVNDFILQGYTCGEIKSIIDNNTFHGLRAQLEFNNLKE